MVQLIDVLEALLLVVCCVIKMEVGSWGTITAWENTRLSRLNYWAF
ncbi:hypothetical protein Goklo_016443 [Gossypium klotzschianum]|uniref:Uncharacterized protein n=1 Tax=Gossypium klotzschianum TaxID=34286 RepID=A0A7J8UE75_9ROSI|nr:hypothetical protein [Gossypium klotzschianum]